MGVTDLEISTDRRVSIDASVCERLFLDPAAMITTGSASPIINGRAVPEHAEGIEHLRIWPIVRFEEWVALVVSGLPADGQVYHAIIHTINTYSFPVRVVADEAIAIPRELEQLVPFGQEARLLEFTDRVELWPRASRWDSCYLGPPGD